MLCLCKPAKHHYFYNNLFPALPAPMHRRCNSHSQSSVELLRHVHVYVYGMCMYMGRYMYKVYVYHARHSQSSGVLLWRHSAAAISSAALYSS